MANNVLVTGAAGYIGKLLVAALAETEGIAHVVAYDLQRAKGPGSTTVVQGDITRDDLAAILREYRIDTVVHLASVLKPPIGAPPDLAWRVDVLGTRRLLGACVQSGVEHLVVTTSGASYGYHRDNPMWLIEEAPARGHPAFEYSRNKRQVEELLAEYRRNQPQLTQLVLRPGTVIGKDTHSPVTAIFEGRVIPGVLGSAAPFVFIWDRDLVNILVTGVLERRQGIYNLAGDGALTAREIARRLGKPYLPLPPRLLAGVLWLLKTCRVSANGPETIDFLRYRPVLDNRRLKEQFGYSPVSSAAAFETWADGLDEPSNPGAPGDADHRPVVVITGGAGGIGRALARRWSREGARLALLDRDKDALEDATAELRASGADVTGIELDVTDFDACNEAIEKVVSACGGIDVLVNNAGAVHRSAFLDTDVEVYRRVMAVNYLGSLHCAKAALPHLLARRGMIVVTSSIAGVAPLYGRTGYAASKHALHGLFESVRSELAETGLRVLMVCPSFTRSPFEEHAMGADGKPAGTKRSMTGRLAEPEEVADAVVRAAARGRELLVLSTAGKLAYYLSRLAPGYYRRAMVKRLKSEEGVR
jgi:UDP-glucose 4-epimerase